MSRRATPNPNPIPRAVPVARGAIPSSTATGTVTGSGPGPTGHGTRVRGTETPGTFTGTGTPAPVRPERGALEAGAESKGAPPLPPPRSSSLAYDLATATVLWRRDLVRFFRQPSRLAGALGQPIIFWFVIGAGMSGTFRMSGAGGPGYLAFFYPGVVLMVVLFASIFTTLSVIEDRHRGFLQAVLAGPGSRFALVLGKTLGSASVALTQAALFLLLAPAAGIPYLSVSWPLLLAALGLAAIGLAALGFAVAWFVDNVQGYHAIQMTLLVPLWVVSGAMFPVPADRPGFAAVMRWNPLSYAVSATRRALAGPEAPGVLPGSALEDLAVCAAFAGAGLLLALLATRRAPRP